LHAIGIPAVAEGGAKIAEGGGQIFAPPSIPSGEGDTFGGVDRVRKYFS